MSNPTEPGALKLSSPIQRVVWGSSLPEPHAVACVMEWRQGEGVQKWAWVLSAAGLEEMSPTQRHSQSGCLG